jgi:hypothetical protein
LASESRERALKLTDSQIEDKYERACFWALTGNRKRALQLLSEAISSGDATTKQAANDIDLVSLHGDPEFEALVQEPNGPITPKSADCGAGENTLNP